MSGVKLLTSNIWLELNNFRIFKKTFLWLLSSVCAWQYWMLFIMDDGSYYLTAILKQGILKEKY